MKKTNNMVTLESLIEALLPYIDRSKISDTALHAIIEEHAVMMEREQALRDMMKDDEELGLYNAE